MTEYFRYSTTPANPAMTAQAPLASSQETFQKMMAAKQVNDSTYWTVMREVFAEDFQTLPKERFKVWASVMSVPLMSRNTFLEYHTAVLPWIENSSVRHALQDPDIGITQQDRNIYKVFDNFNTTSNRMHHMAHLLINGWTPDKLEKLDTIIEIGGGIGDMADIVCKLGFKGKYVIYDFPEVGAIQKWYHDQLGHTNIVHTSDLNDLFDADLMIGTWSFTEMPLDLRNDVMSKMGRTKNWLIAYSNLIFGIDNDKYIREEFVPLFTEHNIEYVDVPFMPWDGGTKYLSIKYNDTYNVHNDIQGE
jgi:hypothetical protein